ncbi:hypothetical protein [Streptomyces sp. SID8352]|uniref:hypothetical protein n=1 Tax=Streptomyces sp. SID8352 TaxID=2690338 RepID=UPI001368A3FD|nr:hypothetical protein [Streptomyces sp. SID8352]MYU24499.1 hypothetical protein [Streptomyces sp. SID8352]
MIRVLLDDVRAADRLIEALYVAAGVRPHGPQAVEWLTLAAALEHEIDTLPPTYPPRDRHRPADSTPTGARPAQTNVPTGRYL